MTPRVSRDDVQNVDTAIFSLPTTSSTAHLGHWAGGVSSASSSSQNVPRKGAGGGSCWVLPSAVVSVFGSSRGDHLPTCPASAASASSSASLDAADNACRLSWAALCLRLWILLPEFKPPPLTLPAPPPSFVAPRLCCSLMTCDREWLHNGGARRKRAVTEVCEREASQRSPTHDLITYAAMWL